VSTEQQQLAFGQNVFGRRFYKLFNVIFFGGGAPLRAYMSAQSPETFELDNMPQ